MIIENFRNYSFTIEREHNKEVNICKPFNDDALSTTIDEVLHIILFSLKTPYIAVCFSSLAIIRNYLPIICCATKEL